VKASIFIGTSLDGFVARSNGDLDFLPPGGGEPHGYDEFMATVDALVIGGRHSKRFWPLMRGPTPGTCLAAWLRLLRLAS